MDGNEVRKILKANKVNLAWLAEQLGISPQSLSSRFNVKEFKRSYLIEMTQVLGHDYFGVVQTAKMEDTRVKIIDVRVCAGNGLGLDGNENAITEYVNIPSLFGTIGLTVYGESMYPHYKSGDVVFVKEILEVSDIDFGRTYLVITRSDRLLKMMYQSKKGDEYVCLKSYNESLTPAGDRQYPDRDIPTSDIVHVYKVIGCLTREQI